jgi:hypothetical protein
VFADQADSAAADELNAGWARIDMATICVEEVMIPGHALAVANDSRSSSFRSYYQTHSSRTLSDPMEKIINSMATVLRTVQEQPPFDIDAIFLILTKLSDAALSFASDQASASAAPVLVRRYTLRYIRELLCSTSHPESVWTASLISAVAEIVLGISTRLPNGVCDSGLQKGVHGARFPFFATAFCFACVERVCCL